MEIFFRSFRYADRQIINNFHRFKRKWKKSSLRLNFLDIFDISAIVLQAIDMDWQ